MIWTKRKPTKLGYYLVFNPTLEFQQVELACFQDKQDLAFMAKTPRWKKVQWLGPIQFPGEKV